MSDSDISHVKKRLARELKIHVVVQVVALCAVGLGLFLFGSKIVPNYPAWDEIHLLCGALALCGMVVFIVTACWGIGKILNYCLLAKEMKGDIMRTKQNDKSNVD